MRLTMATTGKSNVYIFFFISINSSATLMKIAWKVLLNMENQNLECLFDNDKKCLLYTHFILNWVK